MAALLVFAVFLIAIIVSVPIGVSMILGSVAPITLMEKGGSIVQLLNNTFSGANSTPILAVPLFILGGVIMAKGGISKKLFNVFAYFVGRLPGGIPCAVILTCLFYGAISGSGPATTAAVGAMCIPFMTDLGYDKKWSAGLVAVAGGLGVIIPPSIPFVLYSLATGVSTGDLFKGGILPGILIGLFMMAYAVFYCVRKGENRAAINGRMDELKAQGLGKLFLDSIWALLCPVIVLGGIYTGFVTPTEAATVSVFYALIVSLFVYKTISVKDIWPLLCESVKTYGGLAFVLAFATAFGRVLSLTKATAIIEEFVLGNFTSGVAVLTVLVVLFLILGMVMDTGPAIIILAPVFLPIVQALGIDSVHFGVVLVCCLSIGLATPPFGLDLFVAGNIAKEEPMTVAKKAVPFIVAFLAALALITYVPWFSTCLTGGNKSTNTVTTQQTGGDANGTGTVSERPDVDYSALPKVELVGADSTGKGAAGQLFGELVTAKVDEITGGQLTIDYHPNGDLGGDEDLLRQMQSNDIQIVVCQTAPMTSFVPEMAVFDLPMVFAKYDGATIDAVLNGEDSEFRAQLAAAYENAGYHMLGILQNATYRLTTANVDLNTLADFKALQIRTMSNSNHMAFWTAIGAEPTPLAWAEVYFALQSGTIDAEENAADTIVGANLNEVQSVLACTNHILYANQISISKTAWDSLDPLYQQALEIAVSEAMEEMGAQLADIDESNKELLQEKGMKLIEYEESFFDEILALDTVKQLYSDIDAQVNGLGTTLQNELESSVGKAGTSSAAVSRTVERPDADFTALPKVELVGADSTGKGAAGQLFGELVTAKVDEITGGQLTIDYHPNGDLGGDEDLLRQMQANDIQLVVCQTAPMTSFVPEMAVFDLPMVFAKYDGATIDAVLNGEDSEFRAQLAAAYENAGYHMLGILQNATYRLTTANVDLNTLADFKALQIRTMSNSNHMAFWTAIGAEPTPLAWAEVYFALQSGTIDAEENAADTIVGANLNEVQSVLACTNHILYANQICISKAAWDSLDPAYQQALEAAVSEALAEMGAQLADIDKSNKELLQQKGMKLIEYEDSFFDEILALDTVQALYDDIDAQVGGLGTTLQNELEESAAGGSEASASAPAAAAVKTVERPQGDFSALSKIELVGADSTGKGAAGQLFGELVTAKVDEITGGQLTIDYHPNGDLGGDEDLLRQMQANDIQLVVCQTAPMTSFVPEMAVFDLPMVFAKYDGATIDKVLNGEDSEFRAELAAAYEKAGYHMLGILQNATYRLTTAYVDLNTLADFKALQIRTMSNSNHMAFWTAIGAEPTPLAWAEVYFALQSGTIDAEENAADTIVGANLNEVQSVLACTNHILYANQICISKTAWDSLDPLDQQALEAAVSEALAEMGAQLADIDKSNKELLQQKGMKLIEYEDSFFDEILALDTVKQLYDDIDAQVNGLGTALQEELAK